jgi:hypothetical protein
MEYIRADSAGTGGLRIHDEDGMAIDTLTSVVLSAEGLSAHERTEKLTVEELEDSDASRTCSTSLPEMREIVLSYSSESDETKDSGSGRRAMRYQRGASVVDYNLLRQLQAV